MSADKHPDTYVMSRDEWLEVNRVLSGAALSLAMPGSRVTKEKRPRRLQEVRCAQTTMSEVYQRAATRKL